MERHSSRRAGSPRKLGAHIHHPGAWAACDPTSGEEEAFGLMSPSEARGGGDGAGSPKVCSGVILCSPSRRRWPRWRWQGRGAPAGADKGTPLQRQLGDKMSPGVTGCSPRSRPAHLARHCEPGCFAGAPGAFAGAYFHFPDKIPSLAAGEGERHQPPQE